jgi:hypothetical protein
VPGSPDSLPTLEALLGLPNRAVNPSEEEEEDLGLAGLFWLPPDLDDVVPPSASAPEPRRRRKEKEWRYIEHPGGCAPPDKERSSILTFRRVCLVCPCRCDRGGGERWPSSGTP